MGWSKICLTLFIALNLILAFRFFFSPQGIFSYRKLQENHLALSCRVEEMKEKNRLLSREIRLIRDNSLYLETVVRREMNYVNPGEVLYLVTDRQK